MHGKIYICKTANESINTKHKTDLWKKKRKDGHIAFDFDEIIICKNIELTCPQIFR